MLTLAIQKKGRLSTNSIQLLEQCGIHLKGTGQDKLKTSSINFPLEVLFLRDDDIPSCVEDGIADIHKISGSVEIAPGIDMAEAIFDIVSTGSTLISNGLKEVETIIRSEASIYCNKSLSEEKRDLINKLIFRIRSVNTAKDYKYILLNVPNEKLEMVCDILPGMKSPTIMPLGEEGWSSIHSVIKEDIFWDVIEQLKDAGAESLLVTDIEKMIL
jgi:ATP phosphoribosyltransferase